MSFQKGKLWSIFLWGNREKMAFKLCIYMYMYIKISNGQQLN